MHNIFVKGLNRIKWVIMQLMFLKYLRVSAQLIRSLNLAHCMSWSDFKVKNVSRLIRLRNRPSATVKAFFHHMKQRGEQTMQGLPTSLICRLFVCLVIGSYLLIAFECYI